MSVDFETREAQLNQDILDLKEWISKSRDPDVKRQCQAVLENIRAELAALYRDGPQPKEESDKPVDTRPVFQAESVKRRHLTDSAGGLLTIDRRRYLKSEPVSFTVVTPRIVAPKDDKKTKDKAEKKDKPKNKPNFKAKDESKDKAKEKPTDKPHNNGRAPAKDKDKDKPKEGTQRRRNGRGNSN